MMLAVVSLDTVVVRLPVIPAMNQQNNPLIRRCSACQHLDAPNADPTLKR